MRGRPRCLTIGAPRTPDSWHNKQSSRVHARSCDADAGIIGGNAFGSNAEGGSAARSRGREPGTNTWQVRHFAVSATAGRVAWTIAGASPTPVSWQRMQSLRCQASRCQALSDSVGGNAEDGGIGGGCLVEPDGSYAFAIAPRAHDFVVVDPVTGVVLLAADEPVDVAANTRQRRDLDLPLATLNLRFDTDAGYVPAGCIEVRAEDDGLAARMPFTLLGGARQGHAGVALSGHNRRATVFVPPGTYGLYVHHGADRIHDGIISYSSTADRSDVVTLAEGDVEAKVLAVPEAPPIGTK